MILFRADANSSIGMGHVMRCLSIADAILTNTSFPTIVRGKADIKFILADDGVAELIRARGYEPIILHTDYSHMESEIESWNELSDSIDADLIVILSNNNRTDPAFNKCKEQIISMNITESFKNKTLVITGGTGSFATA